MAAAAETALSNFVGGKQVPALDGRTSAVVDPSTGEAYLRAPVSGAADVDAALNTAAEAFETWRDTTPAERSLALLKFADAIEARAEDFIEAESRNTGKPVTMTRTDEVPPLADELRFFAGAARILEGRSAGEYLAGHTSMVRREPIGVCAQVTPWNYPMMMAVWKIAPALAAGNTIVLKPSDTTPVSTLLLAQVAAEFLPPGVLNVICGDRDTGRALVSHDIPQMVSITGSVRAGIEVARAAAAGLKRVHLELGGKAPVVVFDDADPASAARMIADAGYYNAGQDCTAATRVIAGPGIAADLTDALAERARGLRTGGRDLPDADFGPLNNPAQLARVSGFVDRAPDHATVVAGGHPGRRPWLLLRADGRVRPAPGRRDDPGRDLRAGHHGAAVQFRRRGAPLGQRGQVRPRRQRVDPRPRTRDAGRPAPRLRRGLDQHAYPVRLGNAARRLQALRPRQGPVGLRLRGLHED